MPATIETSALTNAVNNNSNGANGNSNNSSTPVLKLRTFTVKEYDALIESGFFDENDKIELLGGLLVEKMPKGTKHLPQPTALREF